MTKCRHGLARRRFAQNQRRIRPRRIRLSTVSKVALRSTAPTACEEVSSSKKDKQRVDAAWRRDFVMGADGLEGPSREPAASSEAAERRSPRVVGADPPQGDGDPVVPRSRREAVADEVRGMALELIEECAQLSSLTGCDQISLQPLKCLPGGRSAAAGEPVTQ